MKRSFLYFLFATLLCLHVTGCSIFGSSDEEDSAEISQEGDATQDEFETDEASSDVDAEAPTDEQFADADTSEDVDDVSDISVDEESFDENEFPDDDEGTEVTDDSFTDDDYTSDDSEIPTETLTENEEEDLFSGEEVVEEVYDDTGSESYDDSSYDDSYADSFAPAPTTFVSVKKMKPAPFRRAGANVNRLYVVRSGDTMSSIARKIYGSDKSADLLSWNGHFRGKTIKVGDKIYYNSPRSPGDSMMKTYYEDSGVSPQYYSARAGDNLRKIAKQLLGHERSWMEIYATNPSVTTKGLFSSNQQLRYWQGSSIPAPQFAANEEPEDEFEAVEEIEEVQDLDPNDDLADIEDGEELEDLDDPAEVALSDDDENFDDLDDEPVIPPPAAGRSQPPTPPSPPPSAKSNKAVNPPPPLAKKVTGSLGKFANSMKKKTSGGKKDTKLMGLLGALMLIVGIVLVVFVRRSRSKRVNFTHTQI